ncbi:phosphatase PAP2 family protein [Candidatus Woesearchaeota archaeon]|nr:phosphatase PAP2 family protein [Candidatus Woesearchaeota archaeon]
MINKDLTGIFQAISLFGTPFFYAPAVLFFLKINQKLAIWLIFILISTEIICGAIKFIYPKVRPMPMPRNTIFQKYRAGSFPSVHTARITAFSVATALSYASAAHFLIALLAVLSVGYSRIYLKKHYFIDVLAGFLIGAVISVLGLNIQF